MSWAAVELLRSTAILCLTLCGVLKPTPSQEKRKQTRPRVCHSWFKARFLKHRCMLIPRALKAWAVNPVHDEERCPSLLSACQVLSFPLMEVSHCHQEPQVTEALRSTLSTDPLSVRGEAKSLPWPLVPRERILGVEGQVWLPKDSLLLQIL